MNKLVLCASLCIGLFLAACGDDSNSVEPSLDESSSSIVKSSSSTTTKKSSSSSSVKSSSSAKSSSSVRASSSSKKVEQSSSSAVISGWTGNLLTDFRDGQTYRTVTIGSQTWMAENLNYETARSHCYNDSAEYCAKYGRLYSWWDVVDSACPPGWHLPQKTEFETLLAAVGDSSIAGMKLKSTSGWSNDKDGTDDFSFSMLPAGSRDSGGGYHYKGSGARFWGTAMSATWKSNSLAPCMALYLGHDDVQLNLADKGNGFSVRCVKD